MKDRAYEIAGNYHGALASMIYKFFDKKTGSGVSANEQQAKGLHKPVIKKFIRKKVYATFKDKPWAGDLPKMESLSSKMKMLNVYYVS